MKFTLSWLKDHLDTEASLDDILDALTDLGLEVKRWRTAPRASRPLPSPR
jgi:hypothetical protein